MSGEFVSGEHPTPRTGRPSPAGPVPKLGWADAGLATASAILSLTLYVRTLAPGLLYGDSGEFQTLVYSLGMTHPTGYPVYVLLGRLFTLPPFGDPAWRVNLFSAVLGAWTVACLYLIVRLLSGWRLAAVAAVLTLAITPLFWYFSVIAELYVPACAFLSSVILCLLHWRHSGKWPWLAVSALLGGLSLGVHSSVALAAPGVLVYLALTARARRDWLAAFGGALLGVLLALAAFFVLDAHNPDAGYYHATVEPALSVWNMTTADFDSPFERLRFLYAARQFHYAMFPDPAETMPEIFGAYVDVIKAGFAPCSLALIGLGLPALSVRRWREGLLLFLGWGVQMFFITNYAISDVVVFFVPTFVFLAVWLGSGLGMLLDILAGGLKRLRRQRWAIPAAALLGAVVLGLTVRAMGGMVARAWAARAPVFMYGSDFAEYPYPLADPDAVLNRARAIVAAVEDEAIVFLGWDMLFPCYYVAWQEGRHGIDFHETYPQDNVPEIGRSAADYIAASLSARPVYFLARPQGSQMRRFDIRPVRRGGVSLYQVVGEQP